VEDAPAPICDLMPANGSKESRRNVNDSVGEPRMGCQPLRAVPAKLVAYQQGRVVGVLRADMTRDEVSGP
jgi:hypothetical protein